MARTQGFARPSLTAPQPLGASRGLGSNGRWPKKPNLGWSCWCAVSPTLSAAQTAASALRLDGFAFRLRYVFSPRHSHWSSDDRLDDVGWFDPGQSKIEALMAIGELFVIDAQEMHHSRMEIADIDRIFSDVVTEVIGSAVGYA